MPIPGSVINPLINPGMMGAVLALYPSLATFNVLTVTQDTTGQEVHAFVPSIDPTLSNLACRKVPLRTDRVEDQKSIEGGGIQRLSGMFRLSFQNYINQLDDTLLTWQVIVDGVAFQINSVESDGSKITTRLMIADITPFAP